MSENDRIFTIAGDDAAQIVDLSLRIAKEYDGPEDEALLRELPLLAAELPAGPRRYLRSFALDDRLGYCIVRGHHIDEDRVGPTPEHWRGRPDPHPEFAEEILLLLYGAWLGEPFGWKTQQDGRLVHDVFPISGYETEQMGVGSSELLTLHTEDAFHPFRADLLLLQCLRNPKGISTIVSEIDVDRLDPTHADVLREDRFLIRPDDSHLPENNVVTGAHADEFDRVTAMKQDDNRVAVLWGDPASPYIRLDPYFMDIPEDDRLAREAFAATEKLMEEGCKDVILEPGDILFINNHRMAHGRRPFTASYDGTDRWLKRVSVTTDLRKSRADRGSATARLV
ncbi:arginine beta-hydroxylase, Fe(II)/alpha-ketoglutarate-dependent [Actinomadura darangshiensis]|uniref:Arginine beta-hydroxylase, Fe(II)/alpha-ketoglutarate-dependent n=1 Tax=Actinomadura darangshiensis TaxID=705336 RepID=A0A4R5BD16_9ACTN|nr:guanitoxin biosynthesis L-enduracididine beta-hydroxylase GntD [Actinomadura darangshiensis]TDD83153.1 arginine beta-hydroxylase, Fe(II)/alpha-ketoglutarate-dependent [Actinomadura darangshiensis]